MTGSKRFTIRRPKDRRESFESVLERTSRRFLRDAEVQKVLKSYPESRKILEEFLERDQEAVHAGKAG